MAYGESLRIQSSEPFCFLVQTHSLTDKKKFILVLLVYQFILLRISLCILYFDYSLWFFLSYPCTSRLLRGFCYFLVFALLMLSTLFDQASHSAFHPDRLIPSRYDSSSVKESRYTVTDGLIVNINSRYESFPLNPFQIRSAVLYSCVAFSNFQIVPIPLFVYQLTAFVWQLLATIL